MPKILLPGMAFYVTNVCNLNCDHCHTFNNYKFKGHFNFDESLYQSWADKVDLEYMEILGGEPTLNPNLKDWMRGLRKLWPGVEGRLLTNGTYLSQVKNLHELAAEYQYIIKITAHSEDLKSLIADQIFSTFGDCELMPVQKLPGYESQNNIQLKTKLGVNIIVYSYTSFQISPFKNSDFEFYDSDPVIAHENCMLRTCVRMIDGKLYKCGLVAVGPDLLKQHNKPIPKVLTDYQPLSATNSLDQLMTLFDPIEACSLCKESNDRLSYNAALKNKKTFKIYNQPQTKQTMA
jgi:organic radical activating enzyme